MHDNIALNSYLGTFSLIVLLVFQKEKKAPDVAMEEKSEHLLDLW